MIKNFLFWQPTNFNDDGILIHWFLFFFSHWFVWVIIFLLTVWLRVKKKNKELLFFWLLLIISQIVETVIKYFSLWPRPFYISGASPPDWIGNYSLGSFPSGHAIRTILILYFLWKEKTDFFWIALPGLAVMNLARILFGLHYPIDIIGGFLIGLVIIAIFSKLKKC